MLAPVFSVWVKYKKENDLKKGRKYVILQEKLRNFGG